MEIRLPIHIRPAIAEDIPQMGTLFRSVIETVCSKDYAPGQLAAWASSSGDLHRWQKLLAETEMIVAEANEGKMAGFAALRHPAHIEMMYTDKDFQGRGVAGCLLKELLGKTSGPVTVHASRTARPFFEKHGFVVAEELFPVRNGIVIPNFRMVKGGCQ
ncbi:GNAT family N-acetyltransferase [Chitinophaga pollutisoli]|uniref:GNAT family N-acetyltransferase n=1 Tax=Chitinophaga pollutisoli TaxID=3133966 RepID=A0ABZ2YLK1_9BACT